jgi:hypothetical protein
MKKLKGRKSRDTVPLRYRCPGTYCSLFLAIENYLKFEQLMLSCVCKSNSGKFSEIICMILILFIFLTLLRRKGLSQTF